MSDGGGGHLLLREVVLDVHERDELARWVKRDGDALVGDVTGTSRATVTRALAGLDIRRGSIALIRQELKKWRS